MGVQIMLQNPVFSSSGYPRGGIVGSYGCCCCLVVKSCLTLCDPNLCSLPGSSVHGIFQTRILEWVATSFSRGSSNPGFDPWSPALTSRFCTTKSSGKPEACCNSILSFWRTSILFPIGAVPICVPTNGVQRFPFLHILANTSYFLCFFNGNHSNMCEVISHSCFDLHFPDG